MGESVLGCGEVWGCGGSPHTLLHLSPHPPHSPDNSSHTHPTTLPTLTQHLSPTHQTRLSTLSHTHLPPSHTLSHPLLFSLPPPHSPHLTPSLHLLHHFPTLPILYHLPLTEISSFSHLLPNWSNN